MSDALPSHIYQRLKLAMDYGQPGKVVLHYTGQGTLQEARFAFPRWQERVTNGTASVGVR